MILKDKLLILSYSRYVYKTSGFCICINPKSKIEILELTLSDLELTELENSPLKYKNSIPDYKELINEYFDSLLNFELG